MKHKWLKYKRDYIYFQRVYSMIKANKTSSEKFFHVPFGGHLFYTNKNICLWYLDDEWVKELGYKIIENLRANNQEGQEYKKNWKIYFKPVLDFSKQIQNTNLNDLSDEELISLYRQFWQTQYNFNSFTNSSIDAVEEHLLWIFRHELGQIVKNSEFEHYYQILSTPSTPTFIQRRDQEIMKIAKKIKDGNLSLQDPPIQKLIDDIVKDYWWTTVGWIAEKTLSHEDIKTDISQYLQDENFANNYAKVESYCQIISKDKNEALLKIKSSQDFLKLLEVFELVAVFHDQRKEGQVKMVGVQNLILQEIVKRDPRLTFYEINWLTFEETLSYFQEKQDFKNIVDQREEHTFCYADKDKYILIEGKKAKIEKDKFIKETNNHEVQEITGMPGSKGIAEGKAVVSNNPHDAFNLMNHGDILVTSQTTPDFVPAMKKAAAIVTDEGGATCHAAIISRELGIPAVVGAKIATEAIKSGMMIKVDANNGIVKII